MRDRGPTLEVARPARITRHDWRRGAVDLPGYAASGLASETMGRGIAEDPLFFASALAGGTALSELLGDIECESGPAGAPEAVGEAVEG